MGLRLPLQALVAVAISVSASASLGQDGAVVLTFHDRRYDGYHTIDLEHAVRDQHPELDPAEMVLRKVDVYAKSRRGDGSLKLWVSGQGSVDELVGGDPSSFDRNDESTFYEVEFLVPAALGETPWKLELRRDIRLRRVVLRGQWR